MNVSGTPCGPLAVMGDPFQRGLVKGVPDWYSDSELTEFLESAGVTAAHRLYQRSAKVGKEAKPTDRVVLTFRPNTERPVRALGYIAKYCKNAVKCKKCAGQHATKDFKREYHVKCANCGGDHPASYVNCKVRLGALARSKAFVNEPRQALKPVEALEVNNTAASQKSPVVSSIASPDVSQAHLAWATGLGESPMAALRVDGRRRERGRREEARGVCARTQVSSEGTDERKRRCSGAHKEPDLSELRNDPDHSEPMRIN
ncbi:hypothetical protein HPB47_014255 [Ixodes persulcatus]|uniref:Uncharacterized protein n=1 Tax=Ixodes persulcatus TaxID=34615 RepID=A0AC60QWE3_IXOPE|nr:hypothetical protein HPB47_014255 [Ixodes persulcatus]